MRIVALVERVSCCIPYDCVVASVLNSVCVLGFVC